MKKLIAAAAILCSFFISCKSNSGDDESSSSSTGLSEKEEKKNITKRDFSITASNSYSDLFLDSGDVIKYLADNHIPDSTGNRMISFYNARNYQYAWFTSSGLTEQALGFWSLSNYSTYTGDTSLKNSSLRKTMDRFYFDDSLRVKASNKAAKNTEIGLTQYFITYARGNYEKGYVKRKEMERFIPTKKETVMKVADSLISKKHKDNKYFEDIN
ncbi:MAG: hypothetical protein ABIR81_04085, partial [Ginsengibacter sp.]